MDDKLLRRVCDAPGIPGFEDEAQRVVIDVLEACCDEVHRDPVGNVIALRKATHAPQDRERPIRVVVDAHVDEVGMMVRDIGEDGMIGFIQVGGLSPQVAQSQRVVIHGTQQTVRGTVVPKGLDNGGNGAKLDELRIDTGLAREALCERVEPGDPITFEDDCSLLNDKMWVGRNFDNRIGTYCMLEAVRGLGDTRVDVYAVSSVQEEVGLRGARPAAFTTAPDIAIVLDGSMAIGAYGEKGVGHCTPGEGTGIYMIDKGTIGHPRLVRYLFELCKARGIAYQRNLGGNTNAQAFQQSRGGVITTTVGAPVRYMHSTVQLCHADDMDATIKMIIGFLETAHEFMAGLD